MLWDDEIFENTYVKHYQNNEKVVLRYVKLTNPL